jgi:hypothetical protein
MNTWLETCARRINELDVSVGALDAEQVAIHLWYGCDGLASCRDMHPVAAAERWHETHPGHRPLHQSDTEFSTARH